GARSIVRGAIGAGFPGGTYEKIFFVADVDGSGPAVDREIHVDLETADFLAVFPLKAKGRVRLVGTALEATDESRSPLTFEDVRDRVVQHLEFKVVRVNWFSTYHVHHRVASRFRDGRVFLLGDSAHVHSPVGGQGMNTGIGDAVNLSWKLAATVQGNAPPSLLDTYEPERIAFARRLVATTDRAFTLVTSQNPLAQFFRTRLFPRFAPLLFRRAAWRRILFRTVSQIGVNYRDSLLSEGEAGSVRGGDRLPWTPTGPDADNFAPLSDLCWQVHIYGDPRPDLVAACHELNLPIYAYVWRSEMARAGLTPGAFYLVRPDGYIALAQPDGRPARLRSYLARRGMKQLLGGSHKPSHP
ncbi:FAD-dependent monooxygenase, partial [Singulisphaera rosea]